MTTQPLLCHPPVLPGESLPSLIARLARLNEYEPRSILTSMIREAWKYDRNARLSYLSLASQFRWLGTLTIIEPYELYRATEHRFVSVLTPQENEIESIELANGLSVPILARSIAHRHVRPEYAGQFCPLCLRVAAYHRLIWLPMVSAACLNHKCLLVSSCPRCEKPVRIPDIIETRCSNCKADYQEVEPILLENDSFGLFTQTLIQTWLTEGSSPVSIDYHLPQQMPRDLYRVLDGLRLCIMQVNHDWPLLHSIKNYQGPVGLRIGAMRPAHLHTLTAYQSYCLYATACKGIINWPMGFHQFLTAYRSREKTRQFHSGNTLIEEFGLLFEAWLSKRWKQANLEFVQQAFCEYLADNHLSFPTAPIQSKYKTMPALTSKLRYMPVHPAAKLLGTTEARLKLIIQSGRLMDCNEGGHSGRVLVKREDVLVLREKWEQALDLKKAANWLGLSRKYVPHLVKVGLLAALQTSAEGRNWMFSPSDVAECLERITERVGILSSAERANGEKMLSVRETAHLLQLKLGSGSYALILQKVTEGHLQAYILANRRLQLKSLKFSQSDIDAYVETIKAKQGWIDCDEVVKVLGISPKSLKSWLKSGLISPVTTEWQTHYYDRQAIEKLKSDLVLTHEASEILGVSESAVCSLMRQGRLTALRGPAVDGYGMYVFSRQGLVGWRQNRLTLHEALCQIQVSYKELVSWVRQGKLLPLEDKVLMPWYFSRQHISSFGEQSKTDTALLLDSKER